MRKHRRIIGFTYLAATLASACIAAAQTAGDANNEAQPVLPTNDHWAAVLLLVIFVGLFLPAAIVGPLLHRRAAAELPELHADQEQDAHTATQHEPGHDISPAP